MFFLCTALFERVHSNFMRAEAAGRACTQSRVQPARLQRKSVRFFFRDVNWLHRSLDYVEAFSSREPDVVVVFLGGKGREKFQDFARPSRELGRNDSQPTKEGCLRGSALGAVVSDEGRAVFFFTLTNAIRRRGVAKRQNLRREEAHGSRTGGGWVCGLKGINTYRGEVN